MNFSKFNFPGYITFAILCIPQIITELFGFAINRNVKTALLYANAAAVLIAVILSEIIIKFHRTKK